jgi:dinuclear metal center YbgI/SA1388 family protein
MITVGKVVEFLDQIAPRSLAESWDNVGLLIGDRQTAATRLMTCLTVTPTTAREAIGRGANMVVTHHPVLFRPVQRLTADEPQGRMLLELIRAGVAVYSPHTAFDGAAGGINDLLAARIGLTGCRPLRPAAAPAQCKIVVFVPPGDLERVSRAMFDAGAGVIGEYRECSFRVAGRGTFFGSDASNPTIGQAGRREHVDEFRLEVVCPQPLVNRVIAALRGAHSYEVPAYDVYPLVNEPGCVGAGRVGELPASESLDEFSRRVRLALGVGVVQAVGELDRRVARVAIGCGSAAEFITEAMTQGCDVLLTGEATYHRQLEAEATGIALVLAGHFATERIGVEDLATRLAAQFTKVMVWASETDRDPAICVPAQPTAFRPEGARG